MKMKLSELKSLMMDALTSKYYSHEEAEKITEVLLFAEMSGKNTMGLVKLLGTEPHQDIKPKYTPKTVKKTELSALIDGGGAAGPLSAQIATNKAIELASKKGFALVGVNNTFSSVGNIGFYARKMALSNLIGIVGASSPRAVIHYNSIDPAYGTNPIAYSFPTETHPIVLDTAASAITFSGLIRAKALGEKLPENVAIDKEGNITTNPDEALKGSILPFDRSYKGAGMAMVVELLAGVLTGSSYVFDEGDWGTIFIAISPDLLIGTGKFKKHAADLVRKVKTLRPKQGHTIRIPGFDTEERIEKIMQSGEIEIEEKLIVQLKEKLKK